MVQLSYKKLFLFSSERLQFHFGIRRSASLVACFLYGSDELTPISVLKIVKIESERDPVNALMNMINVSSVSFIIFQNYKKLKLLKTSVTQPYTDRPQAWISDYVNVVCVCVFVCFFFSEQ